MSIPARRPAPAPRIWDRHQSTLRVTAGTPEDALEPARVCEVLREMGHRMAAAEGTPAGAVQLQTHHFQPQGLSVVVVLPGLRAVLHTWPEHGLATLDLAGADPVGLGQWVTELAVGLRMEPNLQPTG